MRYTIQTVAKEALGLVYIFMQIYVAKCTCWELLTPTVFRVQAIRIDRLVSFHFFFFYTVLFVLSSSTSIHFMLRLIVCRASHENSFFQYSYSATYISNKTFTSTLFTTKYFKNKVSVVKIKKQTNEFYYIDH